MHRITDLTTGRTVARGTEWPTLQSTVADWFGCRADDVHATDDDSVTVDGRVVGLICVDSKQMR